MDGNEIQVEAEVIKKSLTISNAIGNVGQRDEAIPIANVNSHILAKVIEWCRHHKDTPEIIDQEDKDGSSSYKTPSKIIVDITEWDEDFFKVDQGTLFEIMLVIT